MNTSKIQGIIFAFITYALPIAAFSQQDIQRTQPSIEARISNRPGLGIVTLNLSPDGEKIVAETPRGERFNLDESFKIPAAPGIIKLELNPNGEYSLEENLSAPSERWKRVSGDLQSKAYVSEEAKKIDGLIERLEGLTSDNRSVGGGPGRGPASVETKKPFIDEIALRQTIDEATGSVQEAYEKALETNDAQATAQLASVFQSLQDELKSYFGSRDADNYPPASYQNIYNSSFAACKVIIDPDDTEPAKASGCLIAKDLVLTCAHDVEDGEDFQIIFIDGLNRPVSKRKAILLYVGEPRSDNEGRLDFAILKVQSSENDGIQRVPFTLSKKRLSLDTPVYGIGHPGGGDLQIHDYARVVLPYELKEKDRPFFLLRLQADLLRENRLTGRNVSTDQLAKFEFERRYAKPSSDANSYFYRNTYRNTRTPVFGVDTDTFRGDSGGPVILRKSGELIGILVEGMKDEDFFYSATIMSHERCLPIKAIIEQLVTKTEIFPGWPLNQGVRISN